MRPAHDNNELFQARNPSWTDARAQSSNFLPGNNPGFHAKAASQSNERSRWYTDISLPPCDCGQPSSGFRINLVCYASTTLWLECTHCDLLQSAIPPNKQRFELIDVAVQCDTQSEFHSKFASLGRGSFWGSNREAPNSPLGPWLLISLNHRSRPAPMLPLIDAGGTSVPDFGKRPGPPFRGCEVCSHLIVVSKAMICLLFSAGTIILGTGPSQCLLSLCRRRPGTIPG